MKAENREPLLERLATATGCEYLSDLHASSRLPLLREAIAGCAGRGLSPGGMDRRRAIYHR